VRTKSKLSHPLRCTPGTPSQGALTRPTNAGLDARPLFAFEIMCEKKKKVSALKGEAIPRYSQKSEILKSQRLSRFTI